MSLPRRVRTPLLATLAAGVAACGSDSIDAPPTAPAAPTLSSATALAAELVPIDGAAGGTRQRGCPGPKHRQFDFWVGNWDVFTGAGTVLTGTNEVKSLLGGCVVEENWTGSPGGHRGRSLNAFDASSGTWSQMWVDDGGCPNGDVFIEGGLVNGKMVMRGRRKQPEGFLFGPPCFAPPEQVVITLTNRIRWTALTSGSVLQESALATNKSPLPPLPSPSVLAGLRYDPVAQVTPVTPPAPPPSFCPFRSAAAQFDFMSVSGRSGSAAVRVARGTDIHQGPERLPGRGALPGPHRYEGLSFNTFDVFTQKWVRTLPRQRGTPTIPDRGGRERCHGAHRHARAPRRSALTIRITLDAGNGESRGAAVAVLPETPALRGRPGRRSSTPGHRWAPEIRRV